MTVGTPHFTLFDLLLNPTPREPSVDHSWNGVDLFSAYVVEIKNANVILMTVDTRIPLEELNVLVDFFGPPFLGPVPSIRWILPVVGHPN